MNNNDLVRFLGKEVLRFIVNSKKFLRKDVLGINPQVVNLDGCLYFLAKEGCLSKEGPYFKVIDRDRLISVLKAGLDENVKDIEKNIVTYVDAASTLGYETMLFIKDAGKFSMKNVEKVSGVDVGLVSSCLSVLLSAGFVARVGGSYWKVRCGGERFMKLLNEVFSREFGLGDDEPFEEDKLTEEDIKRIAEVKKEMAARGEYVSSVSDKKDK